MFWCIRRKGPLFVAMFHPLGIVIAAALGIIFLGDIFYLGRYVYISFTILKICQLAAIQIEKKSLS